MHGLDAEVRERSAFEDERFLAHLGVDATLQDQNEVIARFVLLEQQMRGRFVVLDVDHDVLLQQLLKDAVRKPFGAKWFNGCNSNDRIDFNSTAIHSIRLQLNPGYHNYPLM